MKIGYLYSKLIKKLHGKSILKSKLSKDVGVGVNCNIVNCTIDKYSYIGHDSQVVNAEIGAFCSISDHVFIGGAEHPMYWVSMSPVFENVKGSLVKTRFVKYDVPVSDRTIIGSDVWIGHAAIIKAGVKIGHGAVVGAGAIVTKDIPPYAIVVGSPAKIIKYRFEKSVINKLLQLEWWNFSDSIIKELSIYINEPYVFIQKALTFKN